VLRNYFKVAVRNLLRHKVYSAINILSLALGMSCCIVLMICVRYFLSYDNFHENRDRIYRIINIFTFPGNSPEHSPQVPGPVGPSMLNDFPEVKNYTRITWQAGMMVRYKDRVIDLKTACFTDPSIFEVFSFKLLKGDPGKALSEPHSIVLTETTAKKIFADEDPMGKVLHFLDMSGGIWSMQATAGDYIVTGIMEDVPDNSHLHFNYLMPLDKQLFSWIDKYDWVGFDTYLLLKDGADPRNLEKKFPGFIKKYLPQAEWFSYYLQPMKDIVIHSGHISGGRPLDVYLYVFSAIALTVLLIACFNYMNLSTARSASRSREVGLRKVLGAGRVHLVRQFLGESVIQSLLAMILVLSLVEVFLPAFNRHFGLNLSLDWTLYAGFIVIALVVGILAGSYPAVILSSFQPVRTLKGIFASGSHGVSLRRVFVLLQLASSIVLIICTLFIARQLNYFQTQYMGFKKEQVINLTMTRGTLGKYQTMKQEFLQNPSIVDVTACSTRLGSAGWNLAFRYEGQNTDTPNDTHYMSVDFNFIPFYSLELVQGRNFSKDFPTDIDYGYIINETLAKRLGWDSPLGKRFRLSGIGNDMGQVIGVIKDFNFSTLKDRIGPLVLCIPTSRFDDSHPGRFDVISLRISPVNMKSTLKFIEEKWNRFEPDKPFEYTFLDEDIARLYESDQLVSRIVGISAFMAVLIACLGLLGLISFSAQQRTKEIGIRKVLGASVTEIILLLSREYLVLLGLAVLIAWPVAWYVMDKWLSGFAYHIKLDWITFILAGVIALAIAALTVSWQAVKAATANPVESLRYE
jgi:putative ABC transport system permease protein